MAKQKRIVENQEHNKKRSKVELEDRLNKPIDDTIVTTTPRISLLGDGRLSITGRRAMATQIGEDRGNLALYGSIVQLQRSRGGRGLDIPPLRRVTIAGKIVNSDGTPPRVMDDSWASVLEVQGRSDTSNSQLQLFDSGGNRIPFVQSPISSEGSYAFEFYIDATLGEPMGGARCRVMVALRRSEAPNRPEYSYGIGQLNPIVSLGRISGGNAPPPGSSPELENAREFIKRLRQLRKIQGFEELANPRLSIGRSSEYMDLFGVITVRRGERASLRS